ncbi:MAG: CvpA family protein [Lachnospiraceae bacterium]|jgi:hypothetical protein|nr:CvpA family protein [Lachnospiraceae bacterium]
MNADTILIWARINAPFIVAIVVFLIIMARSVKRGFVKELFEFISAILASVAVLIIAFAVREAFDKDKIRLILAIVLIILLGVIYKALGLFFTSLKLIAKLPVVNVLDRLAGIVMALFEVIVFIWAVYCLIIIVDGGAFGKWVMTCVRANPAMRFLYEYNYMYNIVANLSQKIRAEEFLNLLEQ